MSIPSTSVHFPGFSVTPTQGATERSQELELTFLVQAVLDEQCRETLGPLAEIAFLDQLFQRTLGGHSSAFLEETMRKADKRKERGGRRVKQIQIGKKRSAIDRGSGTRRKRTARKRTARKMADRAQRICIICSETNSFQWRRGPSGEGLCSDLCNSCGISYGHALRKVTQ